jgi:hypothetical protein
VTIGAAVAAGVRAGVHVTGGKGRLLVVDHQAGAALGYRAPGDGRFNSPRPQRQRRRTSVAV